MAENTRRPSLAEKVFKRASKSWEDDSGISDLKETIKKVTSRRSTMEMGAGEDVDTYSLRTGCNIRFLKDDVEWAFQSQWRSREIFGGFLVIAILFCVFLALFTYPYSITPLENGVVSSIMIGYSVVSLVIMIASRDFFMRHYDFIVPSTVVVICVGNLVIAYLSRVSTVEFPLNNSCYAPGCAALHPSVTVCGLLFFVSTTVRVRFLPCAIATLLIATVEEILLNLHAGNELDLIGFMNQTIAVALIIWGGLTTAHSLEVLSRKTFLLSQMDHASHEAVEEALRARRHPCCPNFELPKEERGCCLEFKEAADAVKYLGQSRVSKLEELDLKGLIVATATEIFFFCLQYPGTAVENSEVPAWLEWCGIPQNTNYDWRQSYAVRFIPLYLLIGILCIGHGTLVYVRKKGAKSIQENTARNRRFGFWLFIVLPVAFGCLWLHQMNVMIRTSMMYFVEASPLEKALCLPQNKWSDIMGSAEYGKGSMSDLVCNMTSSYDVLNGTGCQPKEFAAMTTFCHAFSFSAFSIFAIQTQVLWLLPDMRSGVIALLFTTVYYLVTLIILFGPGYIPMAFKFLPFTIGSILCLYEQTLTSQLAYVIGGHTERRKSVNLKMVKEFGDVRSD